MKKSLLKKLTISGIFIFLFFAGLFSQDPVVTIEGYPEQEFPNVVEALEWIKTQKDITKATVLLPEGDILTPTGFGNMARTVEITIQGAGADKSFIRGYADDEEMPKIGEKGRRFLNLINKSYSGSHWTFKDLTFLRWGVGDGNGGIVVNPKDIDVDLTFINCNFEQIQAGRGAIVQGMNGDNTFTFDNCFIGYSKSYDKDGGMNGMIYKDGGNLKITNCTFMSNDRNPATTGDNNDVDMGIRKAGVISLESSSSQLNFVMEGCIFVDNKTNDAANDEFIQPMISFYPTEAMAVTMKGNIMIGNIREGKENDVDIYIDNPAPIQWSNEGNRLNRAVQRDGDNVVPAEIPESDISLDWTYTHEEIGFVMDGDLPKVLVDEFGVKYVGFDDTSVGILQKNSDSKISIYPNPSSGIFNILIPESLKQSKYEIYNYTGSLVKSGLITNNEAVDISGALKGIYILRVNNNGRNYYQKLIIK